MKASDWVVKKGTQTQKRMRIRTHHWFTRLNQPKNLMITSSNLVRYKQAKNAFRLA